jgi:DNA-binding beta-propeller fold protein YncE
MIASLAAATLLAVPIGAAARSESGRPIALVSAETENELIAIDPRSGQVLRRVVLPADPEYVGVTGSTIVAVSGRAGAVSFLSWPSLRGLKILRGFGQSHLVAFAPDGKWAYVTDDQRGQLDVISLTTRRIVSRLAVGALAHHLAVSPDGRRLWIALSETARTIVTVDTSQPAHPRVSGSFDPGFSIHDLEFSPNGRQVWATAATLAQVGVFDADTHRLLRLVPAGAGPQHVAFAAGDAYITSGYGSSIEMVSLTSDKVLYTATVPYGSFELDTGDGLVVTSSLFEGTVAVLNSQLHVLRVIKVAPVTRDVALIET